MDESLKAKLLARRLGQDDVPIPGVGTVTVRSLSRDEVLHIRAMTGTLAEQERWMLATCMVEPTLTEEEARQWMTGSNAGELEPVTDKIAKLSGLVKDADKETYKSV